MTTISVLSIILDIAGAAIGFFFVVLSRIGSLRDTRSMKLMAVVGWTMLIGCLILLLQELL